ncbi:MAG: ABC transporter ATP-binding protein/permease, partial [Defluviitaleaceae bacterium]|nr:ABC transporter ATP-binding protein/permease [Defluviitaleaceae bacterium]
MKNITQYLSRKIKFIGFVLILLVLVGDFIRNWPVRFIETIVNSALDGDMNTILMFGGLYLIFHLFGALTKSLSNYLSAYLQTDIGISIQNKLYSKLLRVSLISLQGKNSIEITNSLIEDSEFISNNLIAPLVKLFSAIVSFVIALVIMLNISWQLTLITLPCGLVISLTARAISKKSEKNISEKRTKSSYLWKTFAEGIKGVMPIRLYRYDKKYKEIIFTANEEIKKVTLIQRKLEDMSFFFVSTLFMFTIGIIMISSAIFVVRGTMTIGSLTAVMMYNHMLVDPLIDVLDIQQNLIKLKVSLRRV